MIKIDITTPVTISQVEKALTKAFRRGLRDLAMAAEGEWQDAAGRHLHKTRKQYQRAIKLHKVDEDTYEIILHHPDKNTNFLVTAIEAGIKGWDLKPGLLGDQGPSAGKAQTRYSRFAKRKGPGALKVGAPFLDVPFRTGPAMTQSKPNRFRRVRPTSPGWKHPGFRPLGTKGLQTPLREEVKDYIKETVPDVFGPLLRRMKI